MVQKKRKWQPNMEPKKLHKDLSGVFIRFNLNIERYRLFDIFRMENMLVKNKKSSCKTTKYYHRFHKFSNIIKWMLISVPTKVLVLEINYLRTVKIFCYLALITDLISGKIVGHELNDSP